MLTTTRRDIVIGAGLAGIGFGLDKRLAFIAPAHAQKTPDPASGFHTYKVGSAVCTALYDGIWEKPHDPAFIANASIEDTKQALAAAGLTTEFVSIPFTVLAIDTGARLVLCDSGTGGQVQPTAGKMPANMKAAGIDPLRVDTILVSHFHPDHIFGLMAKETNAPVFPNAEIIVTASEYKWWTDPAVIDKLPEARKGLGRRIQAVFPTWKNIRQVEGDVEVAPGIRFVNAPGHTPGHTAFHLASGNRQLMISNDAFYVPSLTVAHPGWHGSYDQNGPLAEASRRKLADRIVAEKIPVAGYHFPFPGSGTIAKDGATYAFVPTKV
jgi:glyoxylase-like metal-dependent hydrolase (beta-lactamase superfamily II)